MQVFRPTGRHHFRLFLITVGVLSVVAAFCMALPPESLARRGGHQRITFAVVGDSIVNELGKGMQSLYHRSRHVRVIKKTRTAAGWRAFPGRGCRPMKTGWSGSWRCSRRWAPGSTGSLCRRCAHRA